MNTQENITTKASAQPENVLKLQEFAELLQRHGFNVIVSRKYPFEWLYFEKDGKLGSVNASHYSGFNFATVNKPSHTHGTGYGITQDGELSLQYAYDSLALVGWGTGKGVEKYKGAQDFIKNNEWAEYHIWE